MLMRMGGIGLQLLWFMLLVRFLPMEQVGIYSVINVFWVLARALGPLGGDSTLLRKVGPLVNLGEFAKIRGMSHQLWRYALVVIFALCVLIYAGLTLFAADSWPFSLATSIMLIIATLGYVSFSILSTLLLSLEKQIAAHAPESLFLPIGIIIGASLLYISDSLTLERLLLLQGAIVFTVLAGYVFSADTALGSKAEPLEKAEAKELHQLSWRLFGTLAFNNLNVRMPVLFSPLVIMPASIALLETASRFAGLLGIVQWCASFVVAPKLSKIDAKQHPEQLQELLNISCWLVFLPALGLFLSFVFLGEWAIALLVGEEYITAYIPLLFISLGFLINTASGPITHYYMILGHERYSFRFSVGETVVAFTLLILLGSQFGVIGISLAFCCGMAFRNFWLNIMLKPLTGLYSPIWSFWRWSELSQLWAKRSAI